MSSFISGLLILSTIYIGGVHSTGYRSASAKIGLAFTITPSRGLTINTTPVDNTEGVYKVVIESMESGTVNAHRTKEVFLVIDDRQDKSSPMLVVATLNGNLRFSHSNKVIVMHWPKIGDVVVIANQRQKLK